MNNNMDQPCLFCRIINKELPSHIVYENDHVLAFLDIHPTTKGHTLVIPKTHTADFLSTPVETLFEVNRVIQVVAHAVLKAVGADGFNLNFNNGSVAGQVIFHLHGHIIPRFSNDGLRLWKGGDYKEGEAAEIAQEIKKHLT